MTELAQYPEGEPTGSQCKHCGAKVVLACDESGVQQVLDVASEVYLWTGRDEQGHPRCARLKTAHVSHLATCPSTIRRHPGRRGSVRAPSRGTEETA